MNIFLLTLRIHFLILFLPFFPMITLSHHIRLCTIHYYNHTTQTFLEAINSAEFIDAIFFISGPTLSILPRSICIYCLTYPKLSKIIIFLTESFELYVVFYLNYLRFNQLSWYFTCIIKKLNQTIFPGFTCSWLNYLIQTKERSKSEISVINKNENFYDDLSKKQFIYVVDLIIILYTLDYSILLILKMF